MHSVLLPEVRTASWPGPLHCITLTVRVGLPYSAYTAQGVHECVSILQDFISEIIPSLKCCTNISPVLSGYGAVHIWRSRRIYTWLFSGTCAYFVQSSVKCPNDHLQPGHNLACFAVTCMTLSKSARSFICLATMAVEQNYSPLLPAGQSYTLFLSVSEHRNLRRWGLWTVADHGFVFDSHVWFGKTSLDMFVQYWSQHKCVCSRVLIFVIVWDC